MSHTSNPLLSNAKSDTHAVASLIENEKLYIERNSSTATEAVAVGMAKNGTQGATNQLVDGKWLDANGLPLPVPPSVGAAGRVPTVLQTGGNTLNKSTANTLNNQLGENLTSREWGRALEALKKENGLRNDFHGRILDNGNYIDDAGKVIGNIGDYLP